MDLVGALNRVFEKVLGVKTADSKKLLDDYIGGGSGGSEAIYIPLSIIEGNPTLEMTCGEIIENLDSGKLVYGEYRNETGAEFLPVLAYTGTSVYCFDITRIILQGGVGAFTAVDMDDYPRIVR